MHQASSNLKQSKNAFSCDFVFKVLTPVIDLKSKSRDEDDTNSNSPQHQPKTLTASLNVRDFDWNVANEYDPMWPNDYEKVAKGKLYILLQHSFCNNRVKGIGCRKWKRWIQTKILISKSLEFSEFSNFFINQFFLIQTCRYNPFFKLNTFIIA